MESKLSDAGVGNVYLIIILNRDKLPARRVGSFTGTSCPSMLRFAVYILMIAHK